MSKAIRTFRAAGSLFFIYFTSFQLWHHILCTYSVSRFTSKPLIMWVPFPGVSLSADLSLAGKARWLTMSAVWHDVETQQKDDWASLLTHPQPASAHVKRLTEISSFAIVIIITINISSSSTPTSPFYTFKPIFLTIKQQFALSCVVMVFFTL